MVTTFTYKPSLVRIDARNFELSWQQLVLGLDASSPWPLQVTKIPFWCDGICWQWQYVPAHGNGIIYLPSQQCF